MIFSGNFYGSSKPSTIAKSADFVPKTGAYFFIFSCLSNGLALHLKGKAVCALNFGRISLVSADFNLVERAEILAAAVMFAVLDCAANVLVCVFGSHNKISLSEIFAVFRRRFILSFAESFILGKKFR